MLDDTVSDSWRQSPGRIAVPAVAAAIIVAFFAVLFFQQASQPYVIDEAEFPLVAEGVAETGQPVYYRGESNPANIGIWHPPLYVYSLGAWQELFGSSHVASRSFGFACILITALFGWLALRRLFPTATRWLDVGWLALFLLHPYVVQSALLPDIDTTILTATTALSVWAAVELMVSSRWKPKVGTLVVGGALGLSFLTKLTTPLALIPLIVVPLAERTRSWARTAYLSLGAFLIAILVLLIGWGVVSVLADLDFGYPFRFTLDSFDSKTGDVGLGDRVEALWPTERTLFWLGPSFLVLFGLGVVACALAWRSIAARACLMLAIVGAGIFLIYNVITAAPFGFPKYYTPAMLPMTLVAVAPFGLWGARAGLALRSGRQRRWAGFGLAAAILGAILIAGIHYGRHRTVVVQPERQWWFVIALTLALAAVLFGVLHRPRSRTLAVGLVLWLAFAGACVALGTSAALQQRSDNASVRYFPGERDLGLAAAEVRRRVDAMPVNVTRDERVVISAKDVGFESGRPYVEDGKFLADPAALTAWLASRPHALVVTRSAGDFSEPIWPEAFAAIRAAADPVWSTPDGDFTIWKSRSTPSPGGP